MKWGSISGTQVRVFMMSCSCPFFRMDIRFALRIAVRVIAYYEACKGTKSKKKKCKWRIHASQLQDGKTWHVCSFHFFVPFNFVTFFQLVYDVALFWQIKKMYDKHTCPSLAKLNHNCMTHNAWVRDRVIDILWDDPTIGAAVLKKDLSKKYNIQI